MAAYTASVLKDPAAGGSHFDENLLFTFSILMTVRMIFLLWRNWGAGRLPDRTKTPLDIDRPLATDIPSVRQQKKEIAREKLAEAQKEIDRARQEMKRAEADLDSAVLDALTVIVCFILWLRKVHGDLSPEPTSSWWWTNEMAEVLRV